MCTHELSHNFGDAVRANATGDVNRETLAGPFVDGRAAFQTLPIRIRIEDEIVRQT